MARSRKKEPPKSKLQIACEAVNARLANAEQMTQRIHARFYELLSNLDQANDIIVNRTRGLASDRSYPLYVLITQHRLPIEERKINLRTYFADHNLFEEQDNPLITTYDPRHIDFLNPLINNNPSLHECYLSHPLEVRFYVGSIAWAIQDEIRSEILEAFEQGLSSAETFKLIEHINKKFLSLFREAMATINPVKLNDAIHKLLEGRPQFIAYVDALTRLELMQPEDEQEKIKCLKVLKIEHENIVLENDSIAEREYEYRQLALKCEMNIIDLSSEDVKSAFRGAKMGMACMVKILDEKDESKIHQIAIQLLHSMQEVCKLPNPQEMDSLSVLIELIHPLLDHQYRKIILEKDFIQRISDICETVFSAMPDNTTETDQAKFQLTEFIVAITQLRATEMWRTSRGYINPHEISIKDAKSQLDIALAELKNKIDGKKECKIDCQNLIKLHAQCRERRDALLQPILLAPVIREADPAALPLKTQMLSIARDTNPDDFVVTATLSLEDNKFRNTHQFQRFCEEIRNNSTVPPAETGARLINLLHEYKPFESFLVTFEKCNVSGMNISGIFRPHITLSDMIARKTHFSNLNFMKVYCKDAIFNYSVFSNCNLYNAEFENCDMQRTAFKNCNLRGMRISANLSQSEIIDTNLKNANLAGSNLSGCSLSNVNFNGANLVDVRFENVSFAKTSMDKAILIDINRKINEKDCDILLATWHQHDIPQATGFYNLQRLLSHPAYADSERIKILNSMQTQPYFLYDKLSASASTTSLYATSGKAVRLQIAELANEIQNRIQPPANK